MPSITETLFALGAGDRVVGITTNCNYPEEAKQIEKIGQFSVNLEKILSLSPDMIIMLESAQKQDAVRLKERGFNVRTVDPRTVDEAIDAIEYIAGITGTTSEGRRIAGELRNRVNRAVRGVSGKAPASVFVMTGYKPLVSAGERTVLNDVIAKAGGVNAVKSAISYPHVSFEELYRQDPDMIVIPRGLVGEEEIKGDPKLSRLRAVRDDRIIWIDPDVLFRPGPRIVDAVESLAGRVGK